jgi:hypothetical protein
MSTTDVIAHRVARDAELPKKFGFTPEHILTAARQQIARAG